MASVWETSKLRQRLWTGVKRKAIPCNQGQSSGDIMKNPYQGIFSPRKKQRKSRPKKEQLIVTSKEDLIELAQLLERQYPITLNLEFK